MLFCIHLFSYCCTASFSCFQCFEREGVTLLNGRSNFRESFNSSNMSKFQRTFSLPSGTTISWLEPKISLPNHFKNGADQNFPADQTKPESVRQEQSSSESGQLSRVSFKTLSSAMWVCFFLFRFKEKDRSWNIQLWLELSRKEQTLFDQSLNLK